MAKLTKAQLLAATNAAVAKVETAAFASGESRARLVSAVLAACGNKPNLVLFEKVRLGVVVGYMASALARKGDNRTEEELRAHCRDRLLHYQGATGSAKLRDGMKGRRTQVEEDAYTSARNLASRLWKDAGITVPTKSGSNSNTKDKADAKAKAKGTNATTKAKANDNAKPTIRKFASAEKFVEYALIQAKAMQGSLNRSAGIAPGRAGEAINHFFSEMLAVADELGLKV